MHDSAELFSRTVPITPRHHIPPHGTRQRTLCSFLPYLRVSHPLDPPPSDPLPPEESDVISIDSLSSSPPPSHRLTTRLSEARTQVAPVQSQGKVRAACSARRVARGSGNAENPCQALRPCPHAIHLPEVAAKCPSTAPIPVSPTAFIASDLFVQHFL